MAKITVRVDDDLFAEAAEVLTRLGMDLPTAIRVFLEQVVLENGLPFRPHGDPFYSRANIRHLKTVLEDSKNNRNLVSHGLVEDSI